jgi:hypothetical protein
VGWVGASVKRVEWEMRAMREEDRVGWVGASVTRVEWEMRVMRETQSKRSVAQLHERLHATRRV